MHSYWSWVCRCWYPGGRSPKGRTGFLVGASCSFCLLKADEYSWCNGVSLHHGRGARRERRVGDSHYSPFSICAKLHKDVQLRRKKTTAISSCVCGWLALPFSPYLSLSLSLPHTHTHTSLLPLSRFSCTLQPPLYSSISISGMPPAPQGFNQRA